MIVKCISTYPTKEQIECLDSGFLRGHNINVVVGREYLVLALTLNMSLQTSGKGVWVDILMESDIPTLISAPLCLFEITDPRVSAYWELGMLSDGSVMLQPRSFYGKSFLENVSNRVAEAVQEFWHVHALMEIEAKTRIRTA